MQLVQFFGQLCYVGFGSFSDPMIPLRGVGLGML